MSRFHNDANVLAIGARMTDYDVITEILDTWLDTEFEGGRHSRRVNKIEV
jgi:ribose 5-phosphate isomerase B